MIRASALRRRLWLAEAALSLALCFAGGAAADEFRPAYLELTQLNATDYDVLWKLPAIDERTTLKLQPAFPEMAEDLRPRTSMFANGAAVQRWRIRVPDGLAGHAIDFPDLAVQRIDVLVRVARADGTTQVGRLSPAGHRFDVTASPGAFEVVRTYTVLGIQHILLGFDHLLFVLALVLLVRDVRRLVVTITAFTVAHSITLGLATLGVLQVPGPPVEASIALSIVFVASEIVRGLRGQPVLTGRRPWLIAFVFGLLHGLGFASALAEVGLPENQIPTALLFFNVGVEIGQLLFVSAVLVAMAGWRALRQRVAFGPPAWTKLAAPYAIGGLASFWFVERVVDFATR